jgi:hypothetical protein
MQASQLFIAEIHTNFAPIKDCSPLGIEAAFLPRPPAQKTCTQWYNDTKNSKWISLTKEQAKELPKEWDVIRTHDQFVLARLN